jgi:hypothetical protein
MFEIRGRPWRPRRDAKSVSKQRTQEFVFAAPGSRRSSRLGSVQTLESS